MWVFSAKPNIARNTAHCLTKSGKKRIFILSFTEGKDKIKMFLAVLWPMN